MTATSHVGVVGSTSARRAKLQAVPLTAEQRRVIRRSLGVAQRLGASPRETKALVEALGVESNYRDLPYGDRDSVGALQQRPSQGWGPASESLETDVGQFLRAAQRINRGGFKGSAGALAQAVQRSAFPDRYHARSGEADSLIAQFLGSSGPGSGGGGGANPSPRNGTTAPPLPGFGITPGPDLSGLLAGLMADEPAPPPTGQLRQSATAASAVLPEGYRGIQSSGAPISPRRDLSSLLEAVSGLGAQLPGVQQPALPGDAQNGGTGSVGKPGGKSAEGVINNLQAWVTGELGLQAGSRDRDRSRNAAAGGSSDSDHLEEQGLFGGREALDIPTTAAQGGWGQYARVARRMGLRPSDNGFTQGVVKIGKRRFRVQVIFGDQNDHGDHIHVGVRRA